MTDADIQALVGALAPVFKGYVESQFAPLLGRVAALEARAPAPDQAAMVAALRPELDCLAQRLAADLGNTHGAALAPILARVDQLEARAPVAGPAGEPGKDGQAGKDAPLPSPEAFQDGIAKAVAEQLGDVMGGPIQETVRGFIVDQVGPLVVRVIDLEKREPIPGPPGDPGKPGRDAPSLAELEETLQRMVSAIPPAAPGKDAEPVDLEALQATITKQVADAVAAIPPAEPGKDGNDLDMETLMEVLQGDINKRVTDAVAAIPPAAPGKDGIGLAGAMVNREGHLVVTLSNGEHTDLGLVIGKDGRDGFSLEHFSADLAEDGRTVLLKFSRADQQEVHELRFPIPIDRGVFKPGSYQRGDAVSWGGSMWIAQKDTDQQPEAGTDWRLAVKRGRDGNDFKPKPPKPHTPVKLGE